MKPTFIIPIAAVISIPVNPKLNLVVSTNSKPLYEPFGYPKVESTIPDAQVSKL